MKELHFYFPIKGSSSRIFQEKTFQIHLMSPVSSGNSNRLSDRSSLFYRPISPEAKFVVNGKSHRDAPGATTIDHDELFSGKGIVSFQEFSRLFP